MALLDLEKIRRDINTLFGYVRCLMAKSDEDCPLVATEWSANHLNVTGNPYTAGTYVFWNGHVYKCLFDNELIPPTNSTYWLDLGEGHLLAEEQSNWNATGGRQFILNKPTNTSDFVNDGEDSSSPYATLNDVSAAIPLPQDIFSVLTEGDTAGGLPINVESIGLYDTFAVPYDFARIYSYKNRIYFQNKLGVNVGHIRENVFALRNGSYEVSISTPTLTGNITASFQNASGVIAYLSDISAGNRVATTWSPNHTTATGNPYTVGTRVWYLGDVYEAIAGNDSIIPTNASYWTNLGPGNLLDQEPIPAQQNADWNSVSGVTEILNKPSIPLYTSDLTNDGVDGVNPFITALDIPSLTGYVPYTGATQDVNLGEFGLLTGNLEFDNTPTNIPTAAGSMYYNDTDGTLDLKLKGGNVTLQVGQEQVVRVVNKTATNITLLEANYQVVRVTGAQGQRMKVDLALATTDALSAETIGLVTETINNNQEGFVTTSGLVRGINTTGSLQSETWADGDILYLSPTVAGNITKVKPIAPNHLIVIGYVIHAHITQGTIFVKVDNGLELDELHDVFIDTPLNNDLLVYETTTDLWKNKSLSLLGIKRNIISEVSNIQNPQNVTQNIVKSFLIPANTFAVKDIMNLSISFEKFNSAGTSTVRVHLNSTISLTGAQLLMTFTSTSTTRYIILKRMFSVFSTTQTQGLLSTSSAVNDSPATSMLISELYTYDIASPKYLIISVQQTNILDYVYTNTISLTN